MTSLVECYPPPEPAFRFGPSRVLFASRAAPFIAPTGDGMTHRTRYVSHHYLDGVTFSYSCITAWCGQGAKGCRLSKTAPTVICATCQGRAEGAGQIARGDGLPVLFSPRVAATEQEIAQVLAALVRYREWISIGKVCQFSDVTPGRARLALDALVSRGLAERGGKSRGWSGNETPVWRPLAD